MKQRIYTFDYIKFIMSLFIAFHHFQQLIGFRGQIINFFDGKVMFNCCVEMFFMISGFLIACKGNKIIEVPFFTFIKEKVKRIWPMSTISIILSAFISVYYYSLVGEWFMGIPISPWRIFISIMLIWAGGPIQNEIGINSPLWYLCVLIYCYVITYFIYWLSKRIELNEIICFIIMMLIGVSTLHFNVNLPFLNAYSARGYSAFFWGVILFHLWNYINEKKVVRYAIPITAVIIIGVIFTFVAAYDLYDDGQLYLLEFCFFPSVIFYLLVINKYIELNIINKIEFGGISFEIYIWHYSIICFISCLKASGIIDLVDNDLTMILYGIGAIIVGTLMHYSLEKRVNRILK